VRPEFREPFEFYVSQPIGFRQNSRGFLSLAAFCLPNFLIVDIVLFAVVTSQTSLTSSDTMQTWFSV